MMPTFVRFGVDSRGFDSPRLVRAAASQQRQMKKTPIDDGGLPAKASAVRFTYVGFVPRSPDVSTTSLYPFTSLDTAPRAVAAHRVALNRPVAPNLPRDLPNPGTFPRLETI